MSDTSSSPPPAPKSGNTGLIIGAVVVASLATAGAMTFFNKASTPAAVSEKKEAAPVPPPPAPVPKVFSDTLADLEVPSAMGPISLKGIKTVNSNLTKAEVEAALKGDTALLTRLNADLVSAESISWVQTIGDSTTSTRYEAVEARAIKAGVIGTLTAPRGTSQGKQGDKTKSDATIEGLSLASFSVPLLLRWFNEADPEGKTPLAPLHGAYKINTMKVVVDGANIDLGPMTLSQTRVRPARRSVASIMNELRTFSEAEKASRAEADKPPAAGEAGKAAAPANAPAPAKPDPFGIVIAAADLLDSFELGEGSVENVRVKAKEPQADGPDSGGLRKLGFAGGPDARFVMEGISATGKDGSMTLDKVSTGGDVATLMLMGAEKALRARATKPEANDEALRNQVALRLKDRSVADAHFSLEGLKGDLPETKGKPEAGRVVFALQKAAFIMGRFVGITPTKIDYRVDGLDIPMPKDSTEPGVVALREMGLQRFGLSARLAADWAEAGQTLSLRELSVEMAQLARMAMSAEVGAIPKAFFEDPERNWPSAMGATINSLVVDIDNRGGLAKLIDVAARDQKKTGDQLRTEMAGIVPLVVGGMLSGHPDGAKVAQALSNFIRNLNGVHMKVTAAGPNGIVLTDLASAQENPQAFLQKLRFEAEGK